MKTYLTGKIGTVDASVIRLNPHFAKAFEFLRRADLKTLPSGRYEIDGESWANVFEVELKGAGEELRFEYHRKYIDIQCPLTGPETIGVKANAANGGEFDAEKDCALFEASGETATLKPGEFVIFFPEAAHAPGLSNEGPHRHRKVVVKVPV